MLEGGLVMSGCLATGTERRCLPSRLGCITAHSGIIAGLGSVVNQAGGGHCVSTASDKHAKHGLMKRLQAVRWHGALDRLTSQLMAKCQRVALMNHERG